MIGVKTAKQILEPLDVSEEHINHYLIRVMVLFWEKLLYILNIVYNKENKYSKGVSMETRSELKKRARKNLKRHYPIFLVVCVIAAFIGTEFIGSLNITKVQMFPEKVITEPKRVDKAVEDALNGKEEESKIDMKELKQEIIKQDQKDKTKILGRSRGIFAMIVNDFSTGSIYVTFITGMNSIIGHPNITSIILVTASLLLSFLLWFFLGNMYQVISRRIFLEGRVYKKVPIQRFLFLLRIKKWNKTAWTMFVTSAFYSLWCLTIVGIVVKRYSYILVPYIVAENPNIKTLDAINLSRRMMHGHKWECFKLEFSYLGWMILGTCTLGLTEVLYSNPYKVATMTEYFAYLRKIAKENKMLGIEKLNDKYLYEKAPKEKLAKEYSDIIEVIKKSREKIKKPQGIKKILAELFGISLSDTKEAERIEQVERKTQRLEIYKNVISRKEYPMRLFSIPEKHQRQKMDTINYMRRYSIWSLIMLFFIFSITGWIWEVALHIIVDGEFVKRGVLYGPWLPIYGFGGVLILTVLNKFRTRPLLQFLTIILLCGTIEYFTSVYLETMYNGQRWWDYSGYFLNLHGRICAEGLLVFGLGGIAIVYIFAPLLDNLIKKIDRKKLIIVCCILLSIYIIDNIYAHKDPNVGAGITDYKAVKKSEINKM